MASDLAPIVLFVYNRPWHTRQTIEALQRNELASASELFIYSDGPKKPEDSDTVHEVRQYIANIGGFRSVTIYTRETNLGLANSIIGGVSDIVSRYGRVIVLEDDMVTSQFFLSFMNESLEIYENEERVISIHGYVWPEEQKLPDSFFLKGADCWGWATWKRGWELFEPDGKKLLRELKAQNLMSRFDYNGAYSYSKMLKDQIIGKNDSWYIRWYASALLNDKLTLYPGKSLLQNIGNDDSGTHCGTTVVFDIELASKPVIVKPILPAEDETALKLFIFFLRSLHIPLYKLILRKLVRIFR